MNTSIVLSGMHSIGIDAYNKFMVNETKVSIKDVPFVRYRFNSYGESEITYMKNMKKKFCYSSHMAEINLDEHTANAIDLLDSIDNIIKYVYITVDDQKVLNGFNNDELELAASLADKFFDRLMLKDKSTTLDAVSSTRLKKQIAEVMDLDYTTIGVCQSPLSFDGKNACLTAVKARELSAQYAENDEVALPSSNHECMNCCGCIRYHIFTNDVEAPVTKKTATLGEKKTTREKDEDGSENQEKAKKPKDNRPKGFQKW